MKKIKGLLFDDRIEIISPKEMLSGITENEYVSGKLPVLRNRNLANDFTDWGLSKYSVRELYELNKSMKKD